MSGAINYRSICSGVSVKRPVQSPDKGPLGYFEYFCLLRAVHNILYSLGVWKTMPISSVRDPSWRHSSTRMM